MIRQIDLFAAHGVIDRVALPDFVAQWESVGQELPSSLRLGTSDWVFPGWRGLIYGQRASEQELLRSGLGKYATHPLMRCVGIAKSFYAPISAKQYRQMAGQVPSDFKFLVTAHAAVTSPPDAYRDPSIFRDAGARFLDAEYTNEQVIRPAVEGLGEHLGGVLFQFPSLGLRETRDAAGFTARLGVFLQALPRGVQYAIEVCNREFLTEGHAKMLAEHGATHAFSVHPKMPTVLEQAKLLGNLAWSAGQRVFLRWMLHSRHDGHLAQRRYFPFDRLVDPDLATRLSLVELATIMMADGQEVMVVADNKAEGSAPCTVGEFAKECLRQWRYEVVGGSCD